MQYIRHSRFGRIIIGRGMKGCKGHGHDDPVLVRVDTVDENDDDGNKEEEKQQAPAFADLDEEFAEIFLDEIASDDKRNDQPYNIQGDPDGWRKGGNGKDDPGNNIRPAPMTGEI